ncbi:hypothetical protein [Terrimonas pollutisoli]|uniref:hypothetical protein n=1 Tax=Terrimonas pollutisoli TaxID=3034147 RepID=UPI0023EBF7DD|nr:hypothetical protein [Terrimonas sp. H1YJ31]
MKAATVHEIKQELLALKPAAITELCLRLARFKKENKELLTYLLFEAHNETAYVQAVKEEMDELFAEINKSHLYFAKKSLRKIIRIINKYCRYSASKQTEVELRLHFCVTLKDSGISLYNTVISNIYQSQLKKVQTVLNTLHEDLQYDYRKKLEELKSH